MTAVFSLRVYTSTNAGTQSAAQTGIDLISADNAVNSSGNRTAHQVVPGTNSFEKWLKLYVETAPANGVSVFSLTPTLNLPAGCTLMWGVTDAGVTPTAATSAIAISPLTARVYWDMNTYTAVGQTTRYLVLQLQTTGSAPAGAIPQDSFVVGWEAQ